jgi:hypothetical protein
MQMKERCKSSADTAPFSTRLLLLKLLEGVVNKRYFVAKVSSNLITPTQLLNKGGGSSY